MRPSGDPEAVVQALRDPSIDVREAAAAELKDRGWSPRTNEERAWFYAGRRLWRSLADLGAPAFEPLAAAASDGAYQLPEVVRALGQTRDPRGLDLLRAFAEHHDWEVRAAAAQALGALAVDQGADALLPLLRDAHAEMLQVKPWTPASASRKNYWTGESVDYPVRRAAIDAIICLRPRNLVATLIALGAVTGDAAERAANALRRVVRERGRELEVTDLQAIATLPRFFRSEIRQTWYRDPEGGVSGDESLDVEIDCADLREWARLEIERRGMEGRS
jgi:HEAT repeat protein